MYNLKYSSKIKHDMKLCHKRGYDFGAFEIVVNKLRVPEPLEIRNKQHNLTGAYIGWSECHISADWLLIYRYIDDCLELYRTGTHADLFGK